MKIVAYEKCIISVLAKTVIFPASMSVHIEIKGRLPAHRIIETTVLNSSIFSEYVLLFVLNLSYYCIQILLHCTLIGIVLFASNNPAYIILTNCSLNEYLIHNNYVSLCGLYNTYY